jgi:hypothetical protein
MIEFMMVSTVFYIDCPHLIVTTLFEDQITSQHLCLISIPLDIDLVRLTKTPLVVPIGDE